MDKFIIPICGGILVKVSYDGLATIQPKYLENDEVYEKFKIFETLVFNNFYISYTEICKEEAMRCMRAVRDFDGPLKELSNKLDKFNSRLKMVWNKRL